MTATFTPPSLPLATYGATIRYSRELLVRAQRQRALHRRLAGKIPDGASVMQGKVETNHGFPVVQLYDLASGDGDRVTCDIVNRIGGKPTMGDKIAADKGSPIVINRDQIVINQARKVIDIGGRMTQKRTPHNLRGIGMNLALNYINNYEDNLFHVQLAGARGYQDSDEWAVPLASDPDFAEVVINPVNPPTFSRKFYPGSATSLANLSTSNTLTLNFFDDLRTRAVTSRVPLKGVSMGEGWGGDDDSPLFLSIISEEGWNSLRKQTTDQNWRTFMANANERLSYKNHPLFRDVEIGLWAGIAIMRTVRAIEFPAGSDALEYANAAAANPVTVQANVRAHRGVLLGCEAMGVAFGEAAPINLGGNKQGSGKTEQLGSYSWVETVEDGGNLLKLFIGMMTGMKKLTYNFEGTTYDNGVVAFDYHVPVLGT